MALIKKKLLRSESGEAVLMPDSILERSQRTPASLSLQTRQRDMRMEGATFGNKSAPRCGFCHPLLD